MGDKYQNVYGQNPAKPPNLELKWIHSSGTEDSTVLFPRQRLHHPWPSYRKQLMNVTEQPRLGNCLRPTGGAHMVRQHQTSREKEEKEEKERQQEEESGLQEDHAEK